jgi:hypothetical protein
MGVGLQDGLMWSMGAGSWVTPENFVPVGGGGGQPARPADAYHGLIDSGFGDTYWNEFTQSWTGFNPPAPTFAAGTVDGEAGTGELDGLVWSATLNGWVLPEYYVAA